MKYIDTLIMHNLHVVEIPYDISEGSKWKPCICADLVRIFGMHEYFLVLFKPGIHGSELNVHKVRQNAINVPSGSMSCLSVPYFDGVFCEVAVIMAIVKIFLEQIKLEEIVWIVGFQPSIDRDNSGDICEAARRFAIIGNTYTRRAEVVSTMYCPPKRIRMRLWHASAKGSSALRNGGGIF